MLTERLGTSLKTLCAAVWREWQAIFRGRMALVVLLVVPVLYPAILSLLYMNEQARARPTIIVDHDNSELSRKLTLRLSAAEEIGVVDRTDSLDEAIDRMERQEVEMLVYLPQDLAKKVKRGERVATRVWASANNMYAYGLSFLAFHQVLMRLNDELGQEFFWQKGLTPQAARGRAFPLAWEERMLYHPEQTYGSYLIPGVLLIVVQQIVLMSLSFSVGLQREGRGRPRRERFPFTAMLGRAVAHLPFWLCGIAFIVFVIFPLFAWPSASAIGMFAIYAALALAMAPMSMAIASFVPDRFVAFQLLLFFSAPIFIMSGYSWPLWQMPPLVQAVASVFPATPALQAVRIISLKNADLSLTVPYLQIMFVQAMGWLAVAFACTHLGARIFGPKGDSGNVEAAPAAAARSGEGLPSA